jgi:phenylalanyl-tRNA synthetase alpha subunit
MSSQPLLDDLVDQARSSFAQALSPADLENAKAVFLGKAGRVTELMKGLAALSVDEKKSRGAAINQTKQAIEQALTEQDSGRRALAERALVLYAAGLPTPMIASRTGIQSNQVRPLLESAIQAYRSPDH